MTFREILDQIKARYDLDTDYKACKILQISQSRVSIALKRESTPSDDVIYRCEKLLELPEGSLLIEFQAQRSKCTEAAKILHSISQRMLGTAAAVLFCIYSVSMISPLENTRPILDNVAGVLCILCKIAHGHIYAWAKCLNLRKPLLFHVLHEKPI